MRSKLLIHTLIYANTYAFFIFADFNMFHVFVMTYPTIFLCFASHEPEGVLRHERVPYRCACVRGCTATRACTVSLRMREGVLRHEHVPYRCSCTAQIEYVRVLPFLNNLGWPLENSSCEIYFFFTYSVNVEKSFQKKLQNFGDLSIFFVRHRNQLSSLRYFLEKKISPIKFVFLFSGVHMLLSPLPSSRLVNYVSKVRTNAPA